MYHNPLERLMDYHLSLFTMCNKLATNAATWIKILKPACIDCRLKLSNLIKLAKTGCLQLELSFNDLDKAGKLGCTDQAVTRKLNL